MPRNVDPSVKKGVGLKQLAILHAVANVHKKPTISSRSNLWQNSSATLKDLMEDQVAKASGLGLKCVYLSQGDRCNDELVQAVLAGEYQIIFLSPEVLLTELRWREMLRTEVYQNNLVGVIVDEAHCVETW